MTRLSRIVRRAALAAGLTALLFGSTAQLAPHARADPAPRGDHRAVKQIDPPAGLLREIARTTGKHRLPSEVSCWQFTTYGDDEGKACNEWDGDDLWVLDQNDNGMQFRVHLETDYHHHRYCADNTSGWTQCAYNHKEGSSVRVHGYFPPHAAGMHWPWSSWLSEP